MSTPPLTPNWINPKPAEPTKDDLVDRVLDKLEETVTRERKVKLGWISPDDGRVMTWRDWHNRKERKGMR